MVGGAEAFGLTALSTLDPAFLELRSLAVDDTFGLGFLVFDDTSFLPGNSGNFDGFNLALLFNFNSAPMQNVGFGTDGFFSSLLSGGFETSAVFGGSGPQLFGDFGIGSVYGTLIQDTASFFELSFLDDLGETQHFMQSFGDLASVSGGQGGYFYSSMPDPIPDPSPVPAPSAFVLLLSGMFGMVVTRRRKEKRGQDQRDQRGQIKGVRVL